MQSMQSDELIRLALAEDIGTGDQTSLAVFSDSDQTRGVVVAKAPLVLAGGPFFARVFQLLDERVEIVQRVGEGTLVQAGERVLDISGPVRAILSGERTALNILQRLSGTATMTRQLVDALAGQDARITDTRKTTPGMRVMEKYAVATGGGANHRFGLDSGVMIKDNHIAAAGSIGAAVAAVRARVPHVLRVEVETTTLAEVDEAMAAGVEVLLLDNMDTPTLQAAVALARSLSPGVLLEASGNMSLDRVSEVAATGVDFISVGALTHSAPAADLSLRLSP